MERHTQKKEGEPEGPWRAKHFLKKEERKKKKKKKKTQSKEKRKVKGYNGEERRINK